MNPWSPKALMMPRNVVRSSKESSMVSMAGSMSSGSMSGCAVFDMEFLGRLGHNHNASKAPWSVGAEVRVSAEVELGDWQTGALRSASSARHSTERRSRL